MNHFKNGYRICTIQINKNNKSQKGTWLEIHYNKFHMIDELNDYKI